MSINSSWALKECHLPLSICLFLGKCEMRFGFVGMKRREGGEEAAHVGVSSGGAQAVEQTAGMGKGERGVWWEGGKASQHLSLAVLSSGETALHENWPINCSCLHSY